MLHGLRYRSGSGFTAVINITSFDNGSNHSSERRKVTKFLKHELSCGDQRDRNIHGRLLLIYLKNFGGGKRYKITDYIYWTE